MTDLLLNEFAVGFALWKPFQSDVTPHRVHLIFQHLHLFIQIACTVHRFTPLFFCVLYRRLHLQQHIHNIHNIIYKTVLWSECKHSSSRPSYPMQGMRTGWFADNQLTVSQFADRSTCGLDNPWKCYMKNWDLILVLNASLKNL